MSFLQQHVQENVLAGQSYGSPAFQSEVYKLMPMPYYCGAAILMF